jgi:HAD superfamily hydrolase (TIGR01459 family)
MTTPQSIAGLGEIADAYDVLLCDVWGVIHNGRESFPAACAALQRYAETRGPVVLISNSPRPSVHVHEQLAMLGVPRGAWTAFVSSGDATRVLLAERAPGPAWAIGPARDWPLYEGLSLDFTDPEHAAFISCTGPVDDERETPEDYRERLAACAARGLEMICANPDKVVQRGDKLVYCGGALADLYAGLGGSVLMAGKPYLRPGTGRGRGPAGRAGGSRAGAVHRRRGGHRCARGDGPAPRLPVHRRGHPWRQGDRPGRPTRSGKGRRPPGARRRRGPLRHRRPDLVGRRGASTAP